MEAEPQPPDGQTNWPQTWWGAWWDSVRRVVCCPPVPADPHCASASPSHYSTGTESWTHTLTHGQARRQPEMRTGGQRRARLFRSTCHGRTFRTLKHRDHMVGWDTEQSRDSQRRQKYGFHRRVGEDTLSHEGTPGCISPRLHRADFYLDMSHAHWSGS